MVSENKTIQTPAKPRCSIVIRAYNEEEHIGRLLEGILQQTIRRVEIVLVDSGSSDATMAIANRYPVQVVHIQPDDFTFGRSLNLGLALTKADLVVIASAHVYPVYPDWLERLLAPFNDPQVGLTYGKQRGNASTRFSERQIFAQWFPETPNPQQPYPFCNNANAAIRRVVWEDTPYDETLSGLEDLAWARQILQQGFQLSYVPEAEVVQPLSQGSHGLQTYLPPGGFWPGGLPAPGQHLHSQRHVACPAAGEAVVQPGGYLLVPHGPVLGYISGLPPCRAAHLAAAPDLLLSARAARRPPGQTQTRRTDPL
jgi:hypothetical protein